MSQTKKSSDNVLASLFCHLPMILDNLKYGLKYKLFMDMDLQSVKVA